MSIHAKLLEGNASRIGIVLYTREDKNESIQLRERYVLDVSTLSTRILNISNRGCGKGEKDSFPISSPIPAQVDLPSTPHYQQHTPLDENALPDLSEQLRAALIRLVVQVERERLQPLEDPSWHMYIEAREGGEAELSARFSDLWIPVSGAIEQGSEETRVDRHASSEKKKIVPIRTVECGLISFQAYMEVFEAAKERKD